MGIIKGLDFNRSYHFLPRAAIVIDYLYLIICRVYNRTLAESRQMAILFPPISS